MALSSGVVHEEGAPVDFQIPSSDSDEEVLDTLAFFSLLNSSLKCPLCRKTKEHFTCRDCLISQDFNHSLPFATRLRERYGDLKAQFRRGQESKKILIQKCEQYTKRKDKLAALINQIENYRNGIKLQKELKSSLQNKIVDLNTEADVLKKLNAQKSKSWPLYRSRLRNMEEQHQIKIYKLNKSQIQIQGRKEYLQTVTKTRIIQLKEYVFPIQQTNRDSMLLTPNPRSMQTSNALYADLWADDDEEDDTVSALIAATSNFGSKFDVSSFGNCHTIPAPSGPTLPSSGDYSPYIEWANKSQGQDKSGVHGTTRNPAHCIAAALTYTTQFVNLIAYYLDLRLPHRLSYSEFTNGDLIGGKFNRKVAKLNANIIHLCASQNIPHNYIQPRRTIPNLLLLFDGAIADLGRRGSFEVGVQLGKSMEESIEKDLILFEEETSESDAELWSESNFPSDWENVQRATITDEIYSPQNMTAHNSTQLSFFSSTIQYNSPSDNALSRSRSSGAISNTTGGGGIISSVTSLFKGWGGGANN